MCVYGFGILRSYLVRLANVEAKKNSSTLPRPPPKKRCSGEWGSAKTCASWHLVCSQIIAYVTELNNASLYD
jgi:hypothetical protein